jgi:hypothetical protein
MKIESSLMVVKNDSTIQATGKERQRPHFIREGNLQIVTTNIDSIYFKETVEAVGKSTANVNIKVASKANEALQGIYFSFLLDEKDYPNGSAKIDNSKPTQLSGNALMQYFEKPAKQLTLFLKNSS